ESPIGRVPEEHSMLRRLPLFLLVCLCTGRLQAQSLEGIEIHGFVTQGFLFSSHNNYLTMQSSAGSLAWTDGAVSVSDSLTDKLRVGRLPGQRSSWISRRQGQDRHGFVQRFPGCGRRLPLDTAAARSIPGRQRRLFPGARGWCRVWLSAP